MYFYRSLSFHIISPKRANQVKLECNSADVLFMTKTWNTFTLDCDCVQQLAVGKTGMNRMQEISHSAIFCYFFKDSHFPSKGQSSPSDRNTQYYRCKSRFQTHSEKKTVFYDISLRYIMLACYLDHYVYESTYIIVTFQEVLSI